MLRGPSPPYGIPSRWSRIGPNSANPTSRAIVTLLVLRYSFKGERTGGTPSSLRAHRLPA
jgi:hypothetical protein